jgi:hypothetical protein
LGARETKKIISENIDEQFYIIKVEMNIAMPGRLQKLYVSINIHENVFIGILDHLM